ncbi:MAG: hypothetical protein ACO1OB_04925 [Archangium sp.]
MNTENSTQLVKQEPKGKIAMPLLLWVAGVPFGIVLLLWFFFFRG